MFGQPGVPLQNVPEVPEAGVHLWPGQGEAGLWELGPDPPAALYPDLVKPRESNSN